MRRRFSEVDVFATTPYSGNPVAVVLDGEGLEHRARCSASPTGRTCPRPRSCCRRPSPTPTTGCASSRRWPSCRSPATRRSAPATPGSSRAAAPAAATWSSRSARAGLVPVRDTPDGLAFSAPPLLRSGPVEEELVGRIADVLGIERAADRGRAVGRQRSRLGRRPARERRGGARARARASTTSTSASSGPYPEGAEAAFEVRAFFPKDGTTGRGPGDGEPQRLARRVAAAHRARDRALRRQPGHRARPRRDACACRQDADGTIWVAGRDGHLRDRTRWSCSRAAMSRARQRWTLWRPARSSTRSCSTSRRDTLVWTINAYGRPLAAFILVGGTLGDR